jgi:hypothetical protein
MLSPDEIHRLPELEWMESRIPKRDALVAFVAAGAVCPPAIELAMQSHPARWFPNPGGNRVLILYEGGAYDASTFNVEREAWDHEHCNLCGDRIPAMTLCHVTKHGRYLVLCESCYIAHAEKRS